MRPKSSSSKASASCSGSGVTCASIGNIIRSKSIMGYPVLKKAWLQRSRSLIEEIRLGEVFQNLAIIQRRQRRLAGEGIDAHHVGFGKEAQRELAESPV